MYIRSRLMAHELRPWQSRMLVKVWKILRAYFQLESSPAMGDQEGITMESHNKSNKPTKHRKHARKQVKNMNKKQTTPGTQKQDETRDTIFPQSAASHRCLAILIFQWLWRLGESTPGPSWRAVAVAPVSESVNWCHGLLTQLQFCRNSHCKHPCLIQGLYLRPVDGIMFDHIWYTAYTFVYLDNDHLINCALLCKNTLSGGCESLATIY